MTKDSSINIEWLISRGYSLNPMSLQWEKPASKPFKPKSVQSIGKKEKVAGSALKSTTDAIGFPIPVKPLSVNECWQGKRFKTQKYKRYERDVLSKLVAQDFPISPYSVRIVASMSNVNSDLDNIAKPLIDILQKKFGFNDRDIFKLLLEKKKVKKGEEGTYVHISTITK